VVQVVEDMDETQPPPVAVVVVVDQVHRPQR